MSKTTNVRYRVVLSLHQSIYSKVFHHSDSIIRTIKSQDIALYNQVRLGVLQNFYSLEAKLKPYITKKIKDNYVNLVLLVAIYQIEHLQLPHYAIVNEAVDNCRELKKNWASSLVNGVLRNYIRTPIATKTLHNEQSLYDHPSWLIDIFKKNYPTKWQKILANNNLPAKICLRINPNKIGLADYCTRLRNQQIDNFVPFGTQGIVMHSNVKITDLPGYNENMFVVQNRSAMLAAEILLANNTISKHEVTHTSHILDMCAAPGGKTTHLLEIITTKLAASKNPIKVKLIVNDINSNRIKLLQQNLATLPQSTLAINDISIVQIDFAQSTQVIIQQLKQLSLPTAFDFILLDAPCSSFGVIRRHPDIKFRRTPAGLKNIQKIQSQLLQNATQLLATDGALLYCTCSVLQTENDQQIATILHRNSTISAQQQALATANIASGEKTKYGWQILPQEEWDGFYFCMLSKN